MRQQQLTIDRHMGYAFDFKVEELKDEPTLQYIHDSWDIAMSTLTPEQRRVWDDSYGRKNRDFLADRPEGKELLRWKYQRYYTITAARSVRWTTRSAGCSTIWRKTA